MAPKKKAAPAPTALLPAQGNGGKKRTPSSAFDPAAGEGAAVSCPGRT